MTKPPVIVAECGCRFTVAGASFEGGTPVRYILDILELCDEHTPDE